MGEKTAFFIKAEISEDFYNGFLTSYLSANKGSTLPIPTLKTDKFTSCPFPQRTILCNKNTAKCSPWLPVSTGKRNSPLHPHPASLGPALKTLQANIFLCSRHRPFAQAKQSSWLLLTHTLCLPCPVPLTTLMVLPGISFPPVLQAPPPRPPTALPNTPSWNRPSARGTPGILSVL